MSDTERLEAAAAKLEQRADQKDQSRSVNPHEGQRGFLAQRAIEERATARLLRFVDACLDHGHVYNSAHALADAVLGVPASPKEQKPMSGDHGRVSDPSDLQQPHRCPHCGDKRCEHGYDPSRPCIHASLPASPKEQK